MEKNEKDEKVLVKIVATKNVYTFCSDGIHRGTAFSQGHLPHDGREDYF